MSVEAVQERLIWLALMLVAVRLAGAVGGVVSTAPPVMVSVTLAVWLSAPLVPAMVS